MKANDVVGVELVKIKESSSLITSLSSFESPFPEYQKRIIILISRLRQFRRYPHADQSLIYVLMGYTAVRIEL